MNGEETIRAPARLESLELLRSRAAAHAAHFGCNAKRVREISLAVEEALVNIFTHAYGEGAEGEVVLACREVSGETLEIEISDSGAPFDPAAFPPPVVAETLAGRKEGGLGISILTRYADAVAYQRVGDQNILTISFTRKDADE